MQRLADILAGDGMELHDFPLGGGQVAAFLEDLVRHGNLSQVVEVAATLECEDGIFVHAQVAAEITGVHGEALAMALRIGIATFDDETECAEHGVGGLEFVGKFLETEERFYAGDQFLRQDWLVQKIVSAGLDASHLVTAVAEASNQDKRNETGSCVLFERAAEIIA